jgi:hypothetical protein
MLEMLISILGNSHFEAYVAGPLLGLIVGCIFSALGTRPPSSSVESRLSPQDTLERIELNQERLRRRNVRDVHHHHYHRGDGKSSDDGLPILIVIGFSLFVAMFLFAAFLPQIAFSLYCFISSVAMFSMTASVLAWVTGQFNTIDWWRHAIFPFVVSLGCFRITVLANQAISDDVVVFARKLLGAGPFSLAVIINGSIKFFRALDDRYVHWMIFDMLAFVSISLCATIALLRCVYYVALSNARVSGREFWGGLALLTKRFSGTSTMIFVSILLLASWFLASGSAYRLFN